MKLLKELVKDRLLGCITQFYSSKGRSQELDVGPGIMVGSGNELTEVGRMVEHY